MFFLGLLSTMLSISFAAEGVSLKPGTGAYVNAEGSPLLPMLKQAMTSIDIEIYTMKSTTVRALLREALARNVKVRIIQDGNPLGVKCKVFDSTVSDNASCADEQSLVTEVQNAGGTYLPFNKAALCGGGKTNCYQHGKIAIIDDQALISTGNFDATNLCLADEKPSTCDRDYSLVIDDPGVLQTLKSIFEADVSGRSYDLAALIPENLKDVLTISPISLDPLVRFVESAKESIDLEAQYLKDPTMNGALLAAARRGVKVSVTVASACAFGKPTSSVVSEITSIYSSFDQAGISTSMFNAANKINQKRGYMHAKVMVVDGKSTWIGSENGSTESLTANREYGMIVTDELSTQKVQSTVLADHSSSASETWQDSLNCAKDRGQSGGLQQKPTTN